MADSKSGDEFVTHEFDEAIAVQRGIVDAETKLAKSHPHAESKAAIAACLTDDKAFLKQLEQLGKSKGATGKVEDVAEGIVDLLDAMVESAGEAPSEAYEAHAVLLNAKRKQQDSAGGMLKIGASAQGRRGPRRRRGIRQVPEAELGSARGSAGRLRGRHRHRARRLTAFDTDDRRHARRSSICVPHQVGGPDELAEDARTG